MKFHCDRCKTRYSIADERVRGKILKIRCKNCSAVITVKEGGSSAEPPAKPAAAAPPIPSRAGAPAIPSRAAGPASGGVKKAQAQAPAIPAAAKRAPVASSTSSTSSRTPAGPSAPAAARPASALQGAFQQALKRTTSERDRSAADSYSGAPATLEAEWYVSLDGDQFGPYALTAAQDWVADREPDDELYCWSEGFDDWLPVEKVSHFRGLRGEGGSEAERDLFGEGDRTVVDAPPGSHQAPRGSLPAPRREDTPVPLFAATMAQMAAEAPTEIDEKAVRGKRNGSGNSGPRPVFPSPGAGRGLPAPGGRPLPGTGRSGPLHAQAQGRAPGPAYEHAPAPKVQSGGPVFPEDSPEAGLEFEIGEASRVVKLPMLGRSLGGAAPAAVGRTTAAVPAIDNSQNGQIGRGTGSFEHMAGTAGPLPLIQGGGTVEIPRPEIMQPRRGSRSLMLPIGIGAAVLITAIVILLYVAMGSDDDDDERLARGRVGGDELAYQFQDDDKDGRDDKTGKTAEETAEAATKSSGTKGRVVKRPGRDSNGGGSGSSAKPPGFGVDETDFGGSGELDGDAFIDVARKNQLGVNLCYNTALKHDPLLAVKKAQVFLSVGSSGTVSSVSIPALTGTEIGECLTRRIKSWRFPKSSAGGSSVLPIVFKS